MTRTRMKIRRYGSALVASTLLFTCGTAVAHQAYVIADLYVLKPGTDNFLILRNGTYHDAGYSITRKMSQDVSLVTGGKRVTPPDNEFSDVDKNPEYKNSYIKVFAEKEGTGVGGVSTIPDYIALPTEMFANYLKHEGMTDALEEFTKVNKLGTIRERYTKNAKGFFQVGKPLTDDYKTKLGYKVEIFVDRNPGSVKVGEELGFQVLYEGKPLKNQLIYASNARRAAPSDSTVDKVSLYAMRTDADGRGKFKITEKDKWFMQLIHMQKLTGDEDADYESNWATLTFDIL